MPYYVRTGTVPRKKHTVHRRGDGELAYEEMIGEEGFSGAASLLYHRGVPSQTIDSRPWDLGDLKTRPNAPLRPLHLRLGDLFPGDTHTANDPVRHRRLVLGNADVRIAYVVASRTSPLYSNATGDECVYVQSGAARLESVFGALDVWPGDYVIVPRTTIHRWVPASADEPLRLFCIEASSHIVHPAQHVNRAGQFLEGSPITERDLRAPDGPLLADAAEADRPVDVYVKHRTAQGSVGSVVTHAHHPFDVEGWDGLVYPYAFNIDDYEPITGRIHQPPPMHQVLEGRNFVMCNFVPRQLDYHPDAIPLPYYHSNVDSDEVLFYSAGDYTARRGTGIGVESLTLHPSGHSHGPQVKAYENANGVRETDETAVMIDTFNPLEIGEAGLVSDDERYAWSWSGEGPDGPLTPDRHAVTFTRTALVLRSDDARPNRDTYGFAGTGGVILEGQLLRPETASRTVFVFMHPSSALNLLPMTERLAERGHHVLCAYSRFVKNDSSLIMEKAVLDLAAWIDWARTTGGYDRVVLVGWSGGGCLSLLYQSQAEQPTITHTPAGDAVDIAGRGLSPADGLVLVAAHLSRAETLTEWLDPSVRDELDPDDRDPDLDIYAATPSEKPPYSDGFVARFRAGQRERNERITAGVLATLDRLHPPERERAFVVHRTMADVRWLDPARDPNGREPRWCYLGDPATANSAPIGLARFTTLRSWLSQWSLEHSAARSDRCAPFVARTPTLLVENGADDAVPATHLPTVHDALATTDKTLVRIDGATHYYRDQPAELDHAIDTVLAWCADRGLVA